MAAPLAGDSSVGSAGGSSGSGVGGGSIPTSPTADWSGDPVNLKDLSGKMKIPCLARVVKGSYMTIGASKFSIPKQHHDVYIHAIDKSVKVLAHCLRKIDIPQSRGRGSSTVLQRLYSMDQRLAIPILYQGWFELLSEDGKSARPIASVRELARTSPDRCIARENIKAYLSSGEGRMIFDKTKIIPAGEQLLLCGEISLPAPSENTRVKLLRCIDSKGEDVYLSFDQKGVFTPIAGEKDITGVFNIRDIVRRFRLPLTVKLAHGVRPRVDMSKFTGIIRLDWVYTEETAFVCPLEKNHVRLLPVPCNVPMQLVPAHNQEEMMNSDQCRTMQIRCARMVANYNNTLHLIVNLPPKDQNAADTLQITKSPVKAEGGGNNRNLHRPKSREDLLMQEIDELYCYVRDGGPPPKTKFQYDSDDESYWEEPSYTPLDEFRASLAAIENGQKVIYPSHYMPPDSKQLKDLIGRSENINGLHKAPLPCGSASSGTSGTAATPEQHVGARTANGQDRVVPLGEVYPDEPPPLPPRPPDLVASSTGLTSRASSATTSPQSNARQSTFLKQPHAVSPSSPENPSHHEQQKRMLRSGSVPALLSSELPTTASPPQARNSPTHKVQHAQSSAAAVGAKLDWKERLRRFDAMQDKEGSSSTSSGSAGGQLKGSNRIAQDFKDSDLSSSRTKVSSGSSGNARKRMQTLYL